jgi:hypothetical protein
MVETIHRPIHARQFHNALVEAGVIRDGENIRRVVIDAQAQHAVVMYVERWGDDRLLDVVPTLEGIEITSSSHQHEWVSLRTASDPDDPQTCTQCGTSRVVPA